MKWGLFLAKDLEPGMLIPETRRGMWVRNKEVKSVSIEERGKNYINVRVLVMYTDDTTAVFSPEDRVQVQGSMVR